MDIHDIDFLPQHSSFCFPIACINACKYFGTWHPYLSHLVQEGKSYQGYTHKKYHETVLNKCPFSWMRVGRDEVLSSHGLLIHLTSYNEPHASFVVRDDNLFLINGQLNDNLIVETTVDKIPLPDGDDWDYAYKIVCDN